MGARFLKIFIVALTVLCTLTLGYTMSIDPFGIYRNNSDDKLSRINQFWYMRGTKPLRLLQADADTIMVGTSRSARLSPTSAGVSSGFNASLPGATPYEQHAMLTMAASLNATRNVIIGLDFDAFLSFHPRQRLGFNADLVQPVQRPSQRVATVAGLKRAFFSSLALRESYRASTASKGGTGAVYRFDGSWNRPRAQYKTTDFVKLSRQKLDSYAGAGELSLAMEDLRPILDICHEESQIKCILLVTPVHLFHLGIMEQAGVLALWREWHRQLVAINLEVAAAHQKQPLPLWGFNDYRPAVGQLLSTRESQTDPWFLDNIHFRPRFGDLMLRRLLQLPGADDSTAGVLLDDESLAGYLDSIDLLRAEFAQHEVDTIRSLYRELGQPEP